MGKEKNIYANLIGICLYVAAIAAGLFIVIQTKAGDIWYDEVFSLGFVTGDRKDIIAYTAKDVHPPLYYFYLKTCISIFKPLGAVAAGKLASCIPLLGMYIIAGSFVRKHYGIQAMGIYSLLITVMPQLAVYYVEIRMYSFAMLIVTMAGCAAIKLLESNCKRIWWCVFFVCSLMAAYTQYFACVAVATIYVMLFIYFITGKEKNKKAAGLVAGLALASAVCYLPWLPSFLKQVGNVSSSYWIEPMTLRSIPGCMKFIFLPISGEGNIAYVAAGLTIVVCLVIYVLLFIKRAEVERKDFRTAFIGIVPIMAIVAVGFAASLMGSPIFTYRYMVPVYGVLYLSITVAMKSLKNRKITAFFIAVVVFSGILSMKDFVYEEQRKATEFEHARQLLGEMPEGSVIIANFDHVATISAYYFPESCVYVYEGETDALVGEMFNGAGTWATNEDVVELIKNNRDVYFLGSFVSRDEIVADWEKIGITSEYIDECMIERYWMNVYRLGLKNEEN